MKFTLFQNFNEVINTIPVERIVIEIKEGTYKSQILYLRKSLEQGKMEPYEKAKKSLLAFMYVFKLNWTFAKRVFSK